MSNERWLKKFEAWDPYNQCNIKLSSGIRGCEGFMIGDNGYCKHYMGCKILISNSCIRECSLRLKSK